MKNLLLTLLICPFLGFAQDSTFIQYSSEASMEFKPIKLVDEFEAAFGMNEKVNFRVKAGLKSFDNLILNTSKTWELSGELGLGKRFSIKLNAYQKPKFASPLIADFLMLDLEIRHYFKKSHKVNSLSGTYLSIARTFNATEFYSLDPRYFGSLNSPSQNRYNNERKLWKLDFGQQYGRFMDIGLRLGLKDVTLFDVNNKALLVPRESRSLMPYLSSFSSISFGLDLPNNKRNTDFCPFLNCNQKLSHLFKIDLSGMLYIDQFTQNIQNEFSFEQKLGKLPFSISLGTVFGLDRYQSFRIMRVERISTEFGMSDVLIYENDLINQVQFTMQAYGELRYYAFQKSMIAKGKIAPGLQGPYLGVNNNWLLFFNRFNTDNLFNWVGSRRVNRMFSPVVGYQRKISKQHFIDLSLRVGGLNISNIRAGDLPINPQFKFGYAF